MAEEMAALEKNDTWELVTLPKGKKNTWDVNESLWPSIKQMGLLRGIKLGWLRKDIHNLMGLTTKTLLHLLPNLIQLECFCLWRLTEIGHFFSLMSKFFFPWRPYRGSVYRSPFGCGEYSNVTMVCKLKKALYRLK